MNARPCANRAAADYSSRANPRPPTVDLQSIRSATRCQHRVSCLRESGFHTTPSDSLGSAHEKHSLNIKTLPRVFLIVLGCALALGAVNVVFATGSMTSNNDETDSEQPV